MGGPTPSGLCERCKVLEFDDSALGSRVGTEVDGYHWETSDYWHDFLDYTLVDSLPALPALSHSAENGCGFCSILCQAIRGCDFAGQKIGIQLRLHSNDLRDYRRCLESLLATIYLEGADLLQAPSPLILLPLSPVGHRYNDVLHVQH